MTDVDRIYRPTVEDLSWALSRRPDSALIVGRPTEALLDALRPLGVEVRSTDARMAALLRRGTYLLETMTSWVVVLSPTGEPGAAEEANDRDASGHLGNSVSIFDSWWADASPVAGSCAVQVGDHVRPLGGRRVGTVTRTLLQSSEYDVQVRIDGRTTTYSDGDLELVAGDPDEPEFWVRDEPGTADDLALTLTYTKFKHPLSDMLYSFAASKTLFRPYQFVPVLKLLNSPSGRILIADEVGLGKTIEAGLIWTELEQRERLRRVLVLSPAALVQKWQAEMRRRFDRKVEVVDLTRIREFAREVSQGRDEDFHAVMSLQGLRGATDVLLQLQDVNPRFDLVIVDEAHAMRNRGTSTHHLGRLLSDWSDTLVFLTATPLNLGRQDLFNLMNLLDGEQFDDSAVFESQLEPNKVLNGVLRDLAKVDHPEPRTLLKRLNEIDAMSLGSVVTQRPDFQALQLLLDVDRPLDAAERARGKRLLNELNTLSSTFTRTRKVDVPDAKAQRVARQIDVDWSVEERRFYNAVRRLYFARAKRMGVPLGFAMQMPLRQAASCIPAMQATLARTEFDDVQVTILEDEDDDGYGIPVDEVSAEDYIALQGLSTPIKQDSKFDALRKRLIEARGHDLRQAMIFSFFTGTLDYLASRLRDDFRVRVMTGRTKMAEREVIMQDFRDQKFDLLLLSQVGSEGLDFEFCNVLVNYDLPWNPMQVEQRIGRLDRFGQKHPKIFIYNMHIPGTIESDIFLRLYHRLRLFEESIGELEPILRDELEHWTKELMDPDLSDEQRIQQADRMAVALEAKKQQVQQLGESSALLSTPDVLDIDGMTDKGPTDGRYVGQLEIHRILTTLFKRFGGSISTPDVEGRALLRGTSELANALSRSRLPRQGSMYSIQHLSQMLRDSEDLPVTYLTETASRHNVELLSSRHPLVRLALDVLGEDDVALRRFGYVGVPGLRRGSQYAVRVDLVESTGIRPRAELWATSIDLASGLSSDDVEAPLLRALAEGTLVEVAPIGVDVPLVDLESRLSERRRAVAADRRKDNTAMAEGRIATRQQGFDRKVQRARETLHELESGKYDQRIRRLHEGRIRNLESDRDEVIARLDASKALTMANHAIAVLIVTGV